MPVCRVVLTGSESTGKTSLAQALAQHYGASWVPEFAREYLAGKGAPLTGDDVEAIARGQLALQQGLLSTSPSLVICDTDLLSTMVYARHYYGESPSWIDEALRRDPADLYLLLDIDVPWVADPQRDRPNDRAEMHGYFRQTLESLDLPHAVIRGSWKTRLQQALSAIEEFRRRAETGSKELGPPETR